MGDLFTEVDKGFDVLVRNDFLVRVKCGVEVVDKALLTLVVDNFARSVERTETFARFSSIRFSNTLPSISGVQWPLPFPAAQLR